MQDRRELGKNSEPPEQPSESAASTERIVSNLAPFAAVAGLAAVVTPIATKMNWVEYAAALALGALAGLVRIRPWRGVPASATEIPPSLIFLASVAFLRSSAGGANSGVAVVALLPVFWTALYGDRRQLCVVNLAMTIFFLAPLVFVGGAAYPTSQYRAAVLFLAVGTIVGFTTQWLVAEVRYQASEAQRLLAREVAAAVKRTDLLSQLTDMASTDALTGLPNRRAWETNLNRALQDGVPFVLAMFDLDRFKNFNDTRGHPAGDRLLKETAAAWREELRSGDFLARIGGEEFALLLPNCTSADALMVVDRLRGRMPYEQTCSAGVVIRKLEESPEVLMTRVDEALYAAKAAGRNRVSLAA
jgi:diguanylate cyclase (GGDEF)-like protein